ncbi:MAG: hypothetical protein ACTSUE_22805 [Promethearchaeota archaeon]
MAAGIEDDTGSTSCYPGHWWHHGKPCPGHYHSKSKFRSKSNKGKGKTRVNPTRSPSSSKRTKAIQDIVTATLGPSLNSNDTRSTATKMTQTFGLLSEEYTVDLYDTSVHYTNVAPVSYSFLIQERVKGHGYPRIIVCSEIKWSQNPIFIIGEDIDTETALRVMREDLKCSEEQMGIVRKNLSAPFVRT